MLRPQLNEANARRLGITKRDLDNALLMSFSGYNVGLYRDGTNLMPILVRLPDDERLNIDSIHDVQLFSSIYERYVQIDEVVDEFKTEWEDALIQRRDRKRERDRKPHVADVEHRRMHDEAEVLQQRVQIRAFGGHAGYQAQERIAGRQ